jgi:MoaA/NifB/PqqE/SkfB family radical SAM enzyme
MPRGSDEKYENLFLALHEQGASLEKVNSFPISLTLDTASVCQLHCPFCVHAKPSPTSPFSVLGWELFSSVLDELGPYLFHVDLSNWGEPLLNKRLLDMISCLKRHGIKVRLSTNLSLPLNQDFLEAFIRTQPDYVVISIDGMSQKTYETYRVAGDFQLAMSNLERLARLRRQLKAEKPRLVWQYLVFSFNQHELSIALQHAKKIRVEFHPSAPYINLDQHPEWLSSQPRFVREKYHTEEKAHGPGPPSQFEKTGPLMAESNPSTVIGIDAPRKAANNEGQAELSFPNHKVRLLQLRHDPCDWLYLKACINADGSLSPCCGLYPGEPDWGQVGQMAFHKLWNSNFLREARATLSGKAPAAPTRLVCASCPVPEIQQDGHDILLDALLDAPPCYRPMAQSALRRFSRQNRLTRQSLRAAGRILSYIPYSYRDLLKQRLRYSIDSDEFRRVLSAISKFVSR